MEIPTGKPLLLTGPNGVGKTALFRTIRNLWPLYGSGHISLPKHSEFFCVPQKPYMAIGTLRDQLYYPFTLREAMEKFQSKVLASL